MSPIRNLLIASLRTALTKVFVYEICCTALKDQVFHTKLRITGLRAAIEA